MMTSEDTLGGLYSALTARGVLGDGELRAALDSARARGLELEAVLIHEKRVPKDALLKTLSEYYGLPSIRYDERMPIPPGLLEGLDDERLRARGEAARVLERRERAHRRSLDLHHG